MKSKSVLNSPRLQELKKQRKKVLLSKCFFVLIGVLIIFFALGSVSRLSRLNIHTVAVAGNRVVDAETIKEKVDANLAGYFLWLFPKTNIFFYPKNKIKENLAENFKRLESISLEVADDRTLKISVSEREALYTWCGENISTELEGEKEKCYFLDKDGFVFDEAPYFSGEVYFKFYGALNKVDEYPPGGYFAKENFMQLISFNETMKKMGLKPVALHKTENEDIKIFLSVNNSSSKNPEIIFKADADLETVAENLNAALTTEPLQTDIKKKYSSLLYIDLRYGNKVYYKFSAQGGSASGGK